MIKQDFVLYSNLADKSVGGNVNNGASSERHHVWEVRHAGLLGIKYEVAVRSDLVDAKLAKEEGEDASQCTEILKGIVDAAVLGCAFLLFIFEGEVMKYAFLLPRLGDNDDDVRAVAASCLLPITTQLVEQLPGELPRVLAVLWMCLGDMKDDLNSSVGAVMDLLGKHALSRSIPGANFNHSWQDNSSDTRMSSKY